MAVMHLPTKVGANVFIKSGDIDISRNSVWWLLPSWILTVGEIGTFRHVGSLVLDVCTKFGSNVSCSL